ncbi:MAG: ABC transporter substrate-binding protein [Deltaproteobacteria bacterium]|nr:ABC transporter substrate-binding protein [Deltaproteobacteria bacterium]
MSKGVFVFICLLPTVFRPAVLRVAQQAKKVPRIGYLSGRLGVEAPEKVFQQGLRELGYIEGQSIIIEWRFARGKPDRLPEFAGELVRLKIDCIVTQGQRPTRAAKQATSTIPIVMANAGDPVRQGFVASLARPGGNITGLTSISVDLAGKRLELLKETFPKLWQVIVLLDAASPGNASYYRETEAAAGALGVKLQRREVRSPDDFESALRVEGKGRQEALIVRAAGLVNRHRARIINIAAKNRLPVMYTDPGFVLGGGLMSYSADLLDQYRRAAIYVDKILKGTKPADIPVEQPTKFELIINLKAAKQIGVTIPPNVLARADKVIK